MTAHRKQGKVILLGYSSIARRRILPALRSFGCEEVDIATRSAPSVQWPGPTAPRKFDEYEAALRETDASVAYVSTVTSHHGRWVRRALESGLHVVVDKPSCASASEARELVALAEQRGLCLAEALVYPYHPQLSACRRAFEESGTSPMQIVAAFSVPPLAPTDFRYRADLGGGALWDMSPYAVTPGRVFFGEEPVEVVARRLARSGDVDTAFSVMMLYPGGRSFVGTFGYTTGYVNRLTLLGPATVVSVERAFSPPPGASATVFVRRHDELTTIDVPPADSFALFLADFFEAIRRSDPGPFHQRLLADAEAVGQLRDSALATPSAGDVRVK
jgi:predicted dehydrogenase